MSKKKLITIIIIEAILLIGAIIFCVVSKNNVTATPSDIGPTAITAPTVETTEPPTEPPTEAPTTEPPTEPPTEPEPTEPPEWVYDENLSRKENIYIYLTDYLGFPEPAACGIISNIAHETGWKFNPKAGSTDGSFGLIQWTGGRLSTLKKWCKKRDKDYKSIQGQLDFMYWELTENDPYGTYDYLMKCTEGKDDAYDAGWYFCFWYERPANTKARARLRGSDAKDYYEELVLGE